MSVYISDKRDSGSYLLPFVPSEVSDGRVWSIDVIVENKEIEISEARKGFMAAKR